MQVDRRKLIAIRNQLDELLKEPEDVIERTLMGVVQKGSEFATNEQIASAVEDCLMESLSRGERIKIGRILKRLGYKHKVQNNKRGWLISWTQKN